jgi:hypothetical protein
VGKLDLGPTALLRLALCDYGERRERLDFIPYTGGAWQQYVICACNVGGGDIKRKEA